MKKELLSLVMASTLSLSSGVSNTMPVMAQESVQTESVFEGGTGSETDPYRIANAEQFDQIRSINTDAFFILTDDIDLNTSSTNPWEPIPGFFGVLDGNGYKISNITVQAGNITAGLFQSIMSGATVKNLGIDNGEISGKYTGSIATFNQGTISNCFNKASVEGSSTVGGIASQNSGTIENCYNQGNITNNGTTTGGTGGICGIGDTASKINNCFNIGEIQSSNSTGGIVGSLSGGEISLCYNSGPVTGTTTRVGGILGHSNASSIENCYNTGSISGANLVGGIAGAGTNSSVRNCYNTGPVNGDNSFGPIYGGTVSQVSDCYYLNGTENTQTGSMQLNIAQFGEEGSFVNWDFTAIWEMGEVVGSLNELIKAPVLQNCKALPIDQILYVTLINEGQIFETLSVKKGQTISRPSDPTKEGFTFVGWFTAAEGGEEWFFSNSVNTNMTLYAQWTEDQSGDSSGSDNGTITPNPAPSPNPNPTPLPNPNPTPKPEPDEDEGDNNGDEGKGPGFTEPGSTTEEDPETGNQTTWTKDDNGTKSKTVQDPDGKVKEAQVTIPSGAIKDGTVYVDLGINQITGEKIYLIPGNITDINSAPAVEINLPEGPGKVVVGVEIRPGTIVNGTVAMFYKAENELVPIPLSCLVDGFLMIPLEKSMTVLIMDNAKSFSDVSTSSPWINAIEWTSAHGLMNGLNAEMFGPDQTLTRGEAAMILYNMVSRPAVTFGNSYGISPDLWFYNAIRYVSSRGWMSGYNNTDFGANDPLSREQLVTILWRFSGKPEASESVLNKYPDSSSISDYAKEAMAWAVENGIVQGKDSGELDPTGSSLRYQIALILQRFVENMYQ